MMKTLTPVSTNPHFYGGTLLTFEASDAELLAQGLAEPHELPKSRTGCKVLVNRSAEHVSSYRMKDGRVRITMPAYLARQRDQLFVGFMAGLTGSASLVLSRGAS